MAQPRNRPRSGSPDPPRFAATRAQALRARSRWRRYDRWQREQLQAMTPEMKLQHCAELFCWAEALEDENRRRLEEQELRARWNRIRQAYRGRS